MQVKLFICCCISANIRYFCRMTAEHYMQRCFALALKGMGAVSPNPMVGCVIVREEQIIGEGYHQQFGQAHAEVNAIRDVFEKHGDKASDLLKEATVYVNLEPCAHFGKTPPCADLLVRHQVRQVIISNTDPFPAVSGKGITRLKEAGITVQTGLLEREGAFLNRRFFTRIRKQRPYLILKWAQTANGYFAPVPVAQRWISGSQAKVLTHQWRAEEDAVLVGKNTALTDNPQLTNRLSSGKNPVRVLIDKKLEVPLSHHLFNAEAKTLVFNAYKTEVNDHVHYIQLEDMTYYLPQKIAFQLYLMDMQSVIIEGGKNILDQFITADLWDEARIFTSAGNWDNGIPAPVVSGHIYEETLVGDDKLTLLLNAEP